uniref:Bm10256 n=1 Tax=Brugia malayi TaxID=6279 RepID=A0A1I9GEJ8_BRUMA|nr:Bm10256 [Brugia malayi]
MASNEQKGRAPSSEAAEKERLLKHEEAAKALGKPIYDDMKVSEVLLSVCKTRKYLSYTNGIVHVPFSIQK